MSVHLKHGETLYNPHIETLNTVTYLKKSLEMVKSKRIQINVM